MTSPTSRTKKLAESQGYTVAIVEKWNQWAKVRQDLFGFGDLLCMKPYEPLLLIQATTMDHFAHRLTKIQHTALSQHWLSTGNRLEIWSWATRGERGKRKLWTVKVHVCEPAEITPLSAIAIQGGV